VQVLEQVQEQVPDQTPEQAFGHAFDQEVVGFEAAAVRWEPCGAVPTLDESGLCAGCGWPEGYHAPAEPAHAGEGAVVIPVPRRERPRLRRAS
jgi:hypothetical protein